MAQKSNFPDEKQTESRLSRSAMKKPGKGEKGIASFEQRRSRSRSYGRVKSKSKMVKFDGFAFTEK